MPLLGVWRYQVRVERVEAGSIRVAQRIASVGRKPCDSTLSGNPEFAAEIEQSMPRRDSRNARRTRWAECLRREKWRIEAGAGIRERTIFLPAVEDAIAASEHEFIRQLVRQIRCGERNCSYRDESIRACRYFEWAVPRRGWASIAAFWPLGTINEWELKSKVACWLLASLMVEKNS